MKKIFPFLIIMIALNSCTSKQFEWESDSFKIRVNDQGAVTALSDPRSGINYLAQNQPAPIMQIRRNGVFLQPTGMTKTENQDGQYQLLFNDGTVATLDIQLMTGDNKAVTEVIPATAVTSSYVKLTLLGIEPADSLDLIVWGPYPTTISHTIGETVGVVRDSVYAIGIQALNLKTLGGFPSVESDIEPSYDIFESNNLIDVADSVKVFYRGQTARKEPFGSVIQAYCRDRSMERIVPNWNHEYYTVPAFDDGGVVGTSIALFGCQVDAVLPTISSIEISEGLPHPTIDGQWGKTSRSATAAYIITGFGVDNFEDALELTKKAGLSYLYHDGPFKNWGHFDLREDQFPENWETLKLMVARAAEEDIKLGVHTLSNFITTNDPYVTPVPDPRLAKVGSTSLAATVSHQDTNIPIDDPKFFNQMKNNTLHATLVGEEIITYSRVSDGPPWILLDCTRGAFGTVKSGHEKGETIGKLMDHPYRTFLTNNELSIEMSDKIAALFNFTGLQQISFDGLEGNWSAGMGQYGRQRFTQHWYDKLNPELQGRVITDASNPGHFFWHVFTRMNWGEPWYAGFRESQTQYRLLNQLYFRRNYIPAMLGWFRMTPQTSLEDIEWLLARSAGFDAGYAMVTNISTIQANGQGDRLLETIKQWESARMSGAFPEEIKNDLQDIHHEYHLEPNGPGSWLLYQYQLWRNEYKKVELQPGQPNLLNLELDNPNPDQPVQFILTAIGEGEAGDFIIIIDGGTETRFPIFLPKDHHLKYTGGSYANFYDPNWQLIDRVRVVQDYLTLTQGTHTFTFMATFRGTGEQSVKLELKTRDIGLEIVGN